LSALYLRPEIIEEYGLLFNNSGTQFNENCQLNSSYD